jgi:hypothetical protein
MTHYLSYSDPDEALEVGFALISQGRWVPHPHYLTRYGPGKSPTLKPEEVLQVFEYAAHAQHADPKEHFFQAEAEIRCADWVGIGFVMWHIEGAFGEPLHVVVTTAYRKEVVQ